MPVDTISLFIGFTDVIVSDSARIRESPPHDRLSESQVRTIHRLAFEYGSANSNMDETSMVADKAALNNDDATSATPASIAGSIVAASPAGSITQGSNMGDFEDPSILGIFDSDSGSENSGDLHVGSGRFIMTYMASGTSAPPDPFSTLILLTATATKVKEARQRLEEVVRKE